MRQKEPLAFGQAFDEPQRVNFKGILPRDNEVQRLVSQGVRPAEAKLADKWQQYFNVRLVAFDEEQHKMVGLYSPDLAEVSDLPIKNWRTLDIMYALEPTADVKQFLWSFNKSDKA